MIINSGIADVVYDADYPMATSRSRSTGSPRPIVSEGALAYVWLPRNGQRLV
jgi:hypothetical protein